MAASSTDNAARTTASMLAEINCETANELVMGVRYATSPPGPTFIPSLDDVLAEARPHPGGSTLQRGDLVEIIGPSGSGKTTILNFTLLTTILPPSMTLTLPLPGSHTVEVTLGGKGKHAAILYPTTHRSPILSLARRMEAHIIPLIQESLSTHLRPKTITPALKTAIDHCMTSSLQRLRVIRFSPRSKHIYLALRTLLTPAPSPGLDQGDHGLELVTIDGFGDGFWPERSAAEDNGAKMSAGTSKTQSVIRGVEDISLKDVFKIIDEIRKELGSVVMLSVQGLWPQMGGPSRSKERDTEREGIMAGEAKAKLERKEGVDEDEKMGATRPIKAPSQRRRTRVYTGFYLPHLPHMPTLPGINSDESPRQWPLNIQLTLRGRSRALQLPADLTLVDALRGLEGLGHAGGPSKSQRFEDIVRVAEGRGPAGTLDGKPFDWAIGPDGLEAWAS